MSVTENTLILETTQGPVTIEMRPDLAPNHVARIKELVREGFYDGIVFHRVILDKQYTVWGKVTAGMENVDKIKRGEPVQNPDKIVKARMAADAE